MKTLMLTKRHPWCDMAERIVAPMEVVRGKSGDPLPDYVRNWSGDWLISFYCPWILPAALLGRVKYAINIHPGSPEYPGFGCYDFALRDQAVRYGATMHYMVPKVDSGPIIQVQWIPIDPGDTVRRLQARTAIASLQLLDHLMAIYPKAPTTSGEWWARQATTRKDLEAMTR
jgi:methionyl-tRNA formyltransferase